MCKVVLTILLTLIVSLGYAAEVSSPLPADQAFVFSAYLHDDHQLILKWDIASGYYLYRSQFSFMPTPASQVALGKISWPAGQMRQDSIHGQYQAYQGSIKIPVLLLSSNKGMLNLKVSYQGCSQMGFCYTPIKKILAVNLAQLTAPKNLAKYVHADRIASSPPSATSSDWVTQLFSGHNLSIIILSFLGLGLLLAFTPCVLPMVPILSGIIVGQGKRSVSRKSFFLSVAYVSGMAVAYAIVGIIVALIGSNIQAELQKPWVIMLFSGLFVLLALSLFGLYELQLPSRWRQRVAAISHQQQGGTYVGVFLMGSLSTLIVSPCVSAPLVGVLAYIGQTGDILLGAVALLALGVGMGIPLLLLGLSADRVLPKAGPWMATVERAFGVMMLGVAIWMLARMVPGSVTLFLWGMLAIFAAVFIGIFSPVPRYLRWLVKGAAVTGLVYGVILLIGAVEGNRDPLHPWEVFHRNSYWSLHTQLPFHVINSLLDFEQQLAQAQQAKQTVLLDFYADWCVSCVEMDRKIFARQDVQQALKKWLVLRVNLTANNAFDQMMLKKFQVIGPPTIIFFTSQGQELTAHRIIGEVSATDFLVKIKEISEGKK